MKTVLITGASSGIGSELTKRYADKGWQVIACGRNADRLQELCDYSPNIQALIFDITDAAQTQEKLSGLKPELSILCSGTCEYIDEGNIQAPVFQRVFDTNVMGPVNCLETLLPQLGQNTRVALVSSVSSWIPLPRAEAYGASKAAIDYLARSLRVSLSPRNIHVSVIMPGFVDTPLTQQNDFEMPMMISAKDAALAIVKGLDSGQDEIAFPRRFTMILNIIKLLPLKVQLYLTKKLIKQ